MGLSEVAFAPNNAYIEEASPSVSPCMLYKLYFLCFNSECNSEFSSHDSVRIQ